MEKDGAKELIKPPLFSVEKPQYDHRTCMWNSRLIIAAHKLETTYCGSANMWTNYTLKREGKTTTYSAVTVFLPMESDFSMSFFL